MEIDDLKRYLQSREVGSGYYDDVKSPFMCDISGFEGGEEFEGVTDVFEKYDKMGRVLRSLRDVTREQFRKLREEIEVAKVGSSSESIALSRSSSEKQTKSLLHVEMMLERLRTTMDTALTEANDALMSFVTAICIQRDRDLVGELGDSVMRSALTSLFEENIWKRDAQFCGNRDAIWLDKLNEVSGLFAQLDAIIKSLHVGDLAHSHHNALANRDLPTSLVEEIKSAEESSINVPESYDYQQLKHMDNAELVNFFNTIIATMRRDHEFAMQQSTEKYFLLKRDYLKERGSAVAHWRSDELDVLRKKIPEVIRKLEDFLSKNRSFPAVIGDVQNKEKLKTRFDRLLQENHILKDRIAVMKGDLKSLETQASVEIARKRENNDFEVDFLITQGLSNLIFLEASRDAEIKLNNLHQKFQEEKQSGMLFEARSHELENELRMEVVEEKKKLVQETLDLRKIVEEKDKLSMDIRDRTSELEKLSIVRHIELESLRAQLAGALKQIDEDEMEVLKLYQKLDGAKEALEQSNREREAALAQAQERHDSLLLSKARDKELQDEMHKIIEGVHGLSKMFDDFEGRISEVIQKNHISLENTNSHLKAITSTSNLSRRSELMYEQRLERKCADLQMAEAEVDLLGDEVEALLRLLEKIYVALYHYSPILKHYPGIVEILELVRRELHGESSKLSRFASCIIGRKGL